jgi:hypothetical protein
LIFKELAVKDYHYFLEVREPVVTNSNDKPGDIDLLLVSKIDPSIPIAFQVKKLKGFIDYKDRKEIINVKTSKISEAIKQSNIMFRNFRLHQNYLMLIVANDRQSFDPNFFSRQIEGPQNEPIYNLHTYQSLNNDVGIFIIEITLEEAVSGASRGMISSKLFRKSSLVPQSVETTNKIQLLLNWKK